MAPLKVSKTGKPTITKVEVRLDPRSTCSRSVLLACAELNLETRADIDYNIIPVNLGKKEQKHPDHMKYQPFGKVPVLITNDIVLYEAEAVMRYLATYIPGSTLIPTDHRMKAHMDKMLSIYSSYFKPAFFGMYRELVLKKRYASASSADMDKVNESYDKTNEVLEVLENEFTKVKGDFMAGDEVSIADLYYFPGFVCLEHAERLVSLIAKRPLLKAWNDRMHLRQSWRTVHSYKEKFFSLNPPKTTCG